MPASKLRIVIVGGSHAGLMTALALTAIGADVAVYERSTRTLEATGAGLRIQPKMADLLQRRGGIDLGPASVFTHWDRHIGPANRVVYEAPEVGHFVSWGSLYRFLLDRHGAERCHFGETFVAAEEHATHVSVRFQSGRVEAADLVILADGIGSTGRQRLLPGVEPEYAGYVAWRGLVAEADLSAETRAALHDACVFTVAGLSHMPIYPVPGADGSTTEGRRLINFIWYRNVTPGHALRELMTDRDGRHRPYLVPAGLVQPRFVARLKAEAAAQLAPAAAEVLIRTPDLLIQPMFDLVAPRMAIGRCILIGDAASVMRPHVGAGTAKAALAAWALADALAAGGDIGTAIGRWEREQIGLARDLVARGAMIGRRAQVEGTFTPGAPELSRITLADQS